MVLTKGSTVPGIHGTPSSLILPEHTEYSLDGEIADRVSIQAARVLGPQDADIVNRATRPVRGFTVDFRPLGAVELLGTPLKRAGKPRRRSCAGIPIITAWCWKAVLTKRGGSFTFRSRALDE